MKATAVKTAILLLGLLVGTTVEREVVQLPRPSSPGVRQGDILSPPGPPLIADENRVSMDPPLHFTVHGHLKMHVSTPVAVERNELTRTDNFSTETAPLLLANEPNSSLNIGRPGTNQSSSSSTSSRAIQMYMSGPSSTSGNLLGEGKEFPLVLITAMFDEWTEVLRPVDENPFTHFVQSSKHSEASSSQSQTAEEQSKSVNPNPSEQSSTASGNGHADQDTNQTSNQVTPPKEAQIMLFFRELSGKLTSMPVKQIDHNRFQSPSGVMIINFFQPSPKTINDIFSLWDDFNGDGVCDVMCVGKDDGNFHLFIGNGEGWDSREAFTLPYRIDCIARMDLFSKKKDQGDLSAGITQKQMICYSSEMKSMDVLNIVSNRYSFSFYKVMTVPLPYTYDGVASTDFNDDGFDDMVLLNVNENRANYLYNVGGEAFRPAGQEVKLSAPIQTQFSASAKGDDTVCWICRFGSEWLIYTTDSSHRLLPVANISSPLRNNECLLIGDLDGSGYLSCGVGIINR